MSHILSGEESDFLTECQKNNFPVDDETLLCLRKYAGLLLYHNKVVNLISRKDEENYEYQENGKDETDQYTEIELRAILY